MNALSTGLAKWGIGLLQDIENNTYDKMEDYDLGIEIGKRHMLNTVMVGLVGKESWRAAVKEFNDNRSGT